MKQRLQRGHVMLELAVSASIMASCLAGTFQFGYTFYVYDQLVTAVGNGARYAAQRTYRAATTQDIERGNAAIRNLVMYGDAQPAPAHAMHVPPAGVRHPPVPRFPLRVRAHGKKCFRL